MTLEQRAGRIDRIGQQRNTVDVVNLFYEILQSMTPIRPWREDSKA